MEPGRSRWAPIAAFAALSASNQMLWLTFTPITTDAARHYGVSSDAIGWLAEIFPLLYVVLAVPAGRLVDRNLPRWLAVGAVLTALGALVRLGDDFGAVIAGQVLIAVAQPLVLNAVTAMSARNLAAPDRPNGIAVSSAGVFAGILLALGLGAAFGGHRVPALVAVQAVLSLAAAVWLCTELRTVPAAPAAPHAVTRIRTVLADRAVRALIGLACAGFGVFVALTTWLQALLEPAGVPAARSGVLLVVLVVAGVAGSAAVPPLLARRHAQLCFVLASVVAAGAALIAFAVAPSFVVGTVAAAVIGFTLLTDLPVVLELVQRRAGPAEATATALVWLAGNAAGLVAALIVQALLHHPAAGFVVLAAMLVAAAPLLAVLRRDTRTATRPRPRAGSAYFGP